MEKMKERLDMFSDAIMAIIITIMVLELPNVVTPSTSEYLNLLRNVGIYFISFCFIANAWYQHAMLFNELKKVTPTIIIVDLIFLASLSLTPLATKIMAFDSNSISVIGYGILILIGHFIYTGLRHLVMKQQYENREQLFEVYQRVYRFQPYFSLLINLPLLFLAYFMPVAVMVLYLVNPIISFVGNLRDRDDFSIIAKLDSKQQETAIEMNYREMRQFRKQQRMRELRERNEKRALEIKERQKLRNHAKLNHRDEFTK